MAAARAQDKGRKVVLIKSNKDSRYAADEVVSHDGLRRVRCCALATRLATCALTRRPALRAFQPCIALSKMERLWDRVTVAEYEAADVIAVDEAR